MESYKNHRYFHIFRCYDLKRLPEYNTAFKVSDEREWALVQSIFFHMDFTWHGDSGEKIYFEWEEFLKFESPEDLCIDHYDEDTIVYSTFSSRGESVFDYLEENFSFPGYLAGLNYGI